MVLLLGGLLGIGAGVLTLCVPGLTAVALLFYIAAWARPGLGALAVLTMIAAYAFLFGVILVLLTFKVRSIGRNLAAK